ncbi:hypothetical protein C818_03756 [Lachnospiraceae bacterium MD308]|nr:hypothetical protein C818_03756 [Lachnospiraceae bacterium MD308]
MLNRSLPTLADQFVSYKKQNGGVYQTGAYYLEKYIQSATETTPKPTVPDRKVLKISWENMKMLREAFIMLLHFYVNSAVILSPVDIRMHI